MKGIIDRFEGEYAVCEKSKTKEMIDIKIEDLPKPNAEKKCGIIKGHL